MLKQKFQEFSQKHRLLRKGSKGCLDIEPMEKKVKNLEPIFRILPSVMIDRSDAQVYFKQDIPLSNMDEYIDKKAQDGIRMSYMNIIYAGIVRIINERPKLNRFVMNGTTYQRDTIYVSLSNKEKLDR